MANQLMTDYIREQRAAGFQDEQIKKSLQESGWELTEIEAGLRETEIPVKPILESPPPQPTPEIPAVEIKKGPRTGLILLIIAVILSLLGISTWLIYQKISKNMFSGTNYKNNIINPSETSSSGNESKNQTYNNAAYGFSINYPGGWKAEENSTSGVIVNIINSTPDTDNGNRFAANINVVSEDTGTLNLADYVKLSKKVLNDTFTNYKVVTENQITINGKDGILTESIYEMGAYQLHNYQMFIINNSKSYVITATTLDSSWNNYKDVLRTALMSFVLK
jgi:hypothetical protein